MTKHNPHLIAPEGTKTVTRAEFQAWATGEAERFGYTVSFQPVGEEDSEVGAATQRGVFTISKE